MYNLIPLVVILFSLTVILFVLVRKFPQVANLDVDNLPEEKVLQKKKELLDKRLEQRSRQALTAFFARLEPVKKLWGRFQLKFRIYVGRVERLWHHEQSLKKKEVTAAAPEVTNLESGQKLSRIIQEAEENLKNGSYDKAEELFIAAIKLDEKSAPAYRGLGDTYSAKNSPEEARETYRFLLQLEPDDDSILVKLADIAESQGDLEEAIGYYQQAAVVNDSFSPRFYHLAELLLKVGEGNTAKEAILQAAELEPKNPKYLDLLIETAIICGDKDLALKGYNDLRLVNAENKKLEDFKDRINKM